MRWWWGWDLRKDPLAEGQIFDLRTYGGILRFVVVSGLWAWGLWHIDDFFVWQGIIAEVNPREQAWHRLIVIGLAIIGYGGALGSALAVYLRHRRERLIRDSAKGQWYDNAALTREELHGSASAVPANDDEDDSPASTPHSSRRT